MENPEMIYRIPINIWDDFYSDGDIPVGKIQETYGYVEDSDIPHTIRIECITILYNHIKSNILLENVEVELDRSVIRFKHLTHKRLDKLVKELNNTNLSYKGVPFEIYSES